MAEVFAEAIGQDETAVLDHAFAYGCLSAAWHAGDANDVEEERELSIAAAVGRCGSQVASLISVGNG